MHLFIDGKNTAYRAIYANNSRGKKHNFVVMLSFMSQWLAKFNPHSIHVFWDAPRNTLWRRGILETYKDRDEKANPDRDIREDLAALQTAAMEFLPLIGVRQYYRKRQEADDLIYAACRAVYPKPAIIVSSDGDFTQVPYFMPNVQLYDARNNKFADKAKCNPVVQKSLMGDESDKVKGYMQIGPVKSAAIAEDIVKTTTFLETVDRQTFIRNMLLVDLSLSPFLLPNQMYVGKVMSKPVSYDKTGSMAAIGRLGLAGLLEEYHKVVSPFKNIVGVGESDRAATEA